MMKNNTHNYIKLNIQLIITFLMAAAIILIGSQLLAIIGSYLVTSDTTVKTYSIDDNDYYMFYTQSDSDITLFPWNYYNPEGVNFYDYFEELTADYDFDYNIDDYVNIDNLYDSIRYYFYQSVPHARQYVLEEDSSLYVIMDFDNIFKKITMAKDSSGIYYFYNEPVTINNQTYNISFALNSRFELLSFQCYNMLDSNAYTPEIISAGKKSITNFINGNNQVNLNLLITDLQNAAGILTSYELHYISQTDEYTVDVADDIYNYFYDIDIYDNYKEYYSNNISEKDYMILTDLELYDSAISEPVTYSYQVVETENDIMIIVLDANIVIHFDPVMQVFTGFNMIYN